MIEIKNLYAGYGKNTVLKDITVSFQKGELTGIIGVNGCGKSTLLRSAVGILPVKSGDILFDETSCSKLKRNDIAKRAAYLSQSKNIPDMTVEQLVLHGRFPHLNYPRRYTERDREIAFASMKRMGILNIANRPLNELSGGMRQNAYIAMTLAQDTDYIFLDEPTTYLDIAHQIELMEILKNLASNGKGIIFVMHDLAMVFNYSDKIVLLNNGELICQGKSQNIPDLCEFEDIFGVKIKYSESEKTYLCIK